MVKGYTHLKNRTERRHVYGQNVYGNIEEELNFKIVSYT